MPALEHTVYMSLSPAETKADLTRSTASSNGSELIQFCMTIQSVHKKLQLTKPCDAICMQIDIMQKSRKVETFELRAAVALNLKQSQRWEDRVLITSSGRTRGLEALS